ncbi:alpha-N-acetylneuraminide alpha-2,8-sialyltransferase-like [Saccoglossus kowalevskii]|uniref:Alpha-N-acetylneuraminide alpha-2,8-sialyltransferase-like n=1 Tax=Saccoglossus kowalevskii TaxID=10224 RepID=A0ABM0M0Y6_SACKO|nr:PREDICTED: alpha-N-acetylneuraminide alpha-2,8-sialyltransferase-like [Saccoglossus kowalevskii]
MTGILTMVYPRKYILEDTIRDVEYWTMNNTRSYDTRFKLYQHLLRHNFSAEWRYHDFLEYAVNNDKMHNKRCSVVGNGGILKNSACGPEIDKANYVFRSNLPSIRNFTYDAGKKTNFSTFNPSIISERYHNNFSGFKHDLDAYEGHILFSRTELIKGAKRAFLSYVRENTTLMDLEADPNYLFAVETFWVCNKRATTGLLLVSLALIRCDELHLFGFWPFDTDKDGNDVPYHYTEDIDWPVTTTHNMQCEFQILRELHIKGVLKLHIDKCE